MPPRHLSSFDRVLSRDVGPWSSIDLASRADVVYLCFLISLTMTTQPLTMQTCTASACDGLNSGRCLLRDKKMVGRLHRHVIRHLRNERETGPS